MTHAWSELHDNLFGGESEELVNTVTEMSGDFALVHSPWAPLGAFAVSEQKENARSVLQACWEYGFMAAFKNRSEEWITQLLLDWTPEKLPDSGLTPATVKRTIAKFVADGYEWGEKLRTTTDPDADHLDALWAEWNGRPDLKPIF